MAVVMAIQKWKHYLIGRKFEVHTDHKSLKFLLEQKEVNMEYQKWLTKLLGYDFEIFYKPGSENKVADGLSRSMDQTVISANMLLLALTVPMVIQLQEIYREVDADKELLSLKQRILEGSLKNGNYQIIDDRVWYKRRLMIPKHSRFISLILSEFHDSKQGGHSGVL